MAIEVIGINELLVALQQAGPRVERGVATKMLKGAEQIATLARSYAPVDEGNLERAIKVATDSSGTGGRRVVAVYVDPTVAAGSDHTVGDYALKMHEGVYNLGPKSLMKELSSGKKVGRKYLSRAFKELSDNVFQGMVAKTRRLLRSRNLFSPLDILDD